MSATTKEKILKTTFLLLLEKGYDRVLVSDIQQALGISRGLMYRYFSSKSDLFLQACTQYFYTRYLEKLDYENMSLSQYLDYAKFALSKIVDIDGSPVEILKYNTLYSAYMQADENFKQLLFAGFASARMVIHNAVLRGEIKDISESFVGATLLAIFGRTSYISETPSNEYVCKRIVEDVDIFYNLIKK